MPDATVRFLEEICRNASLSKYRHFYAASRNKRLNNLIGVPVVIINIALGSVLFFALSEDLPTIIKWTGAFLALGAATCSGIQTFFNFSCQFEGHRAIANKYLKIAYECQGLLSRYRDGLIKLEQLSSQLKDIQHIYNLTNEEAEVFPTSEKDYNRALLKEKERAEGLSERCCSGHQ